MFIKKTLIFLFTLSISSNLDATQSTHISEEITDQETPPSQKNPFYFSSLNPRNTVSALNSSNDKTAEATKKSDIDETVRTILALSIR